MTKKEQRMPGADWGQMSPETVAYISNAISSLTDWLAGSVQQEYVNGQWSYLFPDGMTDAINHLVAGVKQAWFTNSKSKAEEIFEDFPGFEDLNDFPGFSGDPLVDDNSSWWSEVISRPPSWSGNVQNVVNGVVNLALNYIHAIQAPALRQYWNLYYQGYISQSELLAWSGASSMLHFFQVAGADPNFVTPLRTQRQNRQITDAQLINLMGLDNIDQVNQVLGLDWRMAVDVRDQLYMDGFDISFANAQELTSAYVEDLSALNSADAALLQGLIGEMADLGMGDIPMEYRSLIISETLDELVETIAEENSQSASYSSNTQNILVSSNAFVDAMGQKNNSTKKKAVLATAESAINTNFIQSNIALAMRQIEGEQESVGSFQVDPHVSSFGSVSFASPFENDSLVGASNKVG